MLQGLRRFFVDRRNRKDAVYFNKLRRKSARTGNVNPLRDKYDSTYGRGGGGGGRKDDTCDYSLVVDGK